MNLKEFKKELNRPVPIWKEVYYFLYRLWYQLFEEIPHEIKWFFQRGKRGWADCDLWALDDYLAGWLPNALTELRKYQHGYPSELTFKKWQAIEKQMIKSFQAVQKINDLPPNNSYYKNYKKLKKEFEKGGKLFIKYFFSLWD